MTVQTAEPRNDEMRAPMFLQPRPPRHDGLNPEQTQRLSSPPESPSPSPSPSEHGEDFSAVDAEPIADTITADGPSSPVSTRQPLAARALVTAEQVAAARAMVGAVLAGATAMLNRKTRQSESDDRWLMTRDQRETISAPLARILARRSPIPTGGESASDLADGIEAVVGIVGYAIEQMTAERPPAPVYVEQHPADVEPIAPAGPGATANPLDPAFRPGGHF